MTRMSVERAMSEHDGLLALARRLRSVVGGHVAPESAHCLLGEFEACIEDHREQETRDLYEPLLAYAEERSAEFRSMLNEMLTKATRDWSYYLKDWTPDRMEASWSAFGEETRRVLDGGRARLCLEDRLLYPLALRHGLIPLRRVPA